MLPRKRLRGGACSLKADRAVALRSSPQRAGDAGSQLCCREKGARGGKLHISTNTAASSKPIRSPGSEPQPFRKTTLQVRDKNISYANRVDQLGLKPGGGNSTFLAIQVAVMLRSPGRWSRRAEPRGSGRQCRRSGAADGSVVEALPPEGPALRSRLCPAPSPPARPTPAGCAICPP